jgi:hypothetical protein
VYVSKDADPSQNVTDPVSLVSSVAEQVINDQSVRLYLIPGVPEDTAFSPKCRCEIKEIRWFDINNLPLCKSDQVSFGLINYIDTKAKCRHL